MKYFFAVCVHILSLKMKEPVMLCFAMKILYKFFWAFPDSLTLSGPFPDNLALSTPSHRTFHITTFSDFHFSLFVIRRLLNVDIPCASDMWYAIIDCLRPPICDGFRCAISDIQDPSIVDMWYARDHRRLPIHLYNWSLVANRQYALTIATCLNLRFSIYDIEDR